MPSSVKEGRVTKAKSKSRSTSSSVLSSSLGKRRREHAEATPKPLPLVERTNALPIDQFIEKYVPQSSLQLNLPGPKQKQKQTHDDKDKPADRNGDHDHKEQDSPSTTNYIIDIHTAQSVPPADFQACFNLIELTSSNDYMNSSIGWSPAKKRKEMKLPDMRYILLRPALAPGRPDTGQHEGGVDKAPSEEGTGAGKGQVLGFLSFMVTYEDGKEVIYCYEIHLSPTLRGKGAGKHLMTLYEEIGRRVGLEKAMLTVFKANTVARRFYDLLGYDVDEYSPQPRRLRNGTVKEPDYLILSKALKGNLPDV
ncbi:hypothetical protein VTN00DRAFT_8388 [Thermoascus crustaceus]|uniref:uncharacterized protein n=1 Tax=Thermoascus crustaceus TaxID=5088 RepID=UPI003742968D